MVVGLVAILLGPTKCKVYQAQYTANAHPELTHCSPQEKPQNLPKEEPVESQAHQTQPYLKLKCCILCRHWPHGPLSCSTGMTVRRTVWVPEMFRLMDFHVQFILFTCKMWVCPHHLGCLAHRQFANICIHHRFYPNLGQCVLLQSALCECWPLA